MIVEADDTVGRAAEGYLQIRQHCISDGILHFTLRLVFRSFFKVRFFLK